MESAEKRAKDPSAIALQTSKCTFDEMDLLRALSEDLQQDGDSKTMGHITYHRCRPDWDSVFQELQKEHPKDEIGIMMCGPRAIANDLKVKCGEYSELSG